MTKLQDANAIHFPGAFMEVSQYLLLDFSRWREVGEEGREVQKLHFGGILASDLRSLASLPNPQAPIYSQVNVL
jgi:hypothetical protein